MTQQLRLTLIGAVGLVTLALVGCGGGGGAGPTDGGAGSGGAAADAAPGGTGGGTGGGAAGTGGGMGGTGGSAPGTIPTTFDNKDTYAFMGADAAALYQSVKGTYKVDCVAARGPKGKVGLGYFIVKPDQTITALDSDGVEVLTLSRPTAAGGAAMSIGGLTLLSIAASDMSSIYLTFGHSTGVIQALAGLPGGNGMRCAAWPGQTLQYGAAVPAAFAAAAGTHKMARFGGQTFDLTITAEGKVTLTETSPMAGMVRYMGMWQGGVVPVTLQAGDFALYDKGSTTRIHFQLVASGGSVQGGVEFDWDGTKALAFNADGLTASPAP